MQTARARQILMVNELRKCTDHNRSYGADWHRDVANDTWLSAGKTAGDILTQVLQLVAMRLNQPACRVADRD
jgi:hypothetical protein